MSHKMIVGSAFGALLAVLLFMFWLAGEHDWIFVSLCLGIVAVDFFFNPPK
jgi:hypothetical protein